MQCASETLPLLVHGALEPGPKPGQRRRRGSRRSLGHPLLDASTLLGNGGPQGSVGAWVRAAGSGSPSSAFRNSTRSAISPSVSSRGTSDAASRLPEKPSVPAAWLYQLTTSHRLAKLPVCMYGPVLLMLRRVGVLKAPRSASTACSPVQRSALFMSL